MELKELLTIVEKENCAIESVQYLDSFNRSVSFVPLELAHQLQDPQRDDMAGHYHIRSEILNLVSNPPAGNTLLEELFEKAQQLAKSSAGWKQSLTKEAKAKYLEIHGNIVGVIGQAGIGKTTLTRYLLKQILDDGLYDAEFVFYVKFREIDYEKPTNLLRFLCKNLSCEWLENRKRRCDVLHELAKNEKVYIIMDGFDEADINCNLMPSISVNMCDNAKPSNFIFSLLAGLIFPKSKKFVTSRPRQLIDLPAPYRPDFVVKILGISEEAQKLICKNICSENHKSVFEHIYNNPQLSACCFVPINCILIMHVMKQISLRNKDVNHLPVNITEVFSVVIMLFLQTKHLRHDFDLQRLAKLAWVGIENQKLYFNEDDLISVGLQDIDRNTFTVTIRRKNENDNLSLFTKSTTNYTYFSHLLFQEFFAAFHLMFFLDLKVFKKLFFSEKHFFKFFYRSQNKSGESKLDFFDSKFENVAKFLFGFCNQSTTVIFENNIKKLKFKDPFTKINLLKQILVTKLNTISSNNLANKENFQRILQNCAWIHEMKDDKYTQNIANLFPEYLFVTGDFLPLDVLPLHCVLRARTMPVTIEINRHAHFIGDSLQRFLRELNDTVRIQPKISVHV